MTNTQTKYKKGNILPVWRNERLIQGERISNLRHGDVTLGHFKRPVYVEKVIQDTQGKTTQDERILIIADHERTKDGVPQIVERKISANVMGGRLAYETTKDENTHEEGSPRYCLIKDKLDTARFK